MSLEAPYRRALAAVATLVVGADALAQQIPAEERAALTAAAQALELGRRGGGDLWPGYSVGALPLAIFYRGSHSYLLQHPSPPDGFARFDTDLVDAAVYRGPHLPQMNANTAGQVAGAITAFVDGSYLRSGDHRDVALVLHEMTHAFQARAPGGGAPRWPTERSALVADYPVLDPDNNAWGRVEGRALRAALNADSDAWRPHARAFLAARAARRERLSAELSTFEDRLELNEGLADYLPMRAMALADRHRPMLRALADRLGAINVAGHGAARQRFYSTGAAQAWLLDRTATDWKTEVETDGRSLHSLLADALESPPADRRTVAAEHDFDALLAFEHGVAASRAAQLRGKALEVLATEGRLLVLDLSRAGRVDMLAYDPMNIVRADDDSRIHQRMLRVGFEGGELSTETPTVHRVSRAWWICELPDGELSIDGKELPDGFATDELACSTLELRAGAVSLTSGAARVATAERVLVVAPGASDALPLDGVRSMIQRARDDAARPTPAPPFEIADVHGALHRHPDGSGRQRALLFFSAAPWAVPAHHFVRELLSGSHGDPTSERLLLVATQCSAEQLDELLPVLPTRPALIHDADQQLRTLFGIETVPAVVWIDTDGFLEPPICGFRPARVRALIDRLRDS